MLRQILLCPFSVINTRVPFVEFMQRPDIVKLEPWFGFEEEYWVTDRDGIPLGWEMNKDFIHNSKTFSFSICIHVNYTSVSKIVTKGIAPCMEIHVLADVYRKSNRQFQYPPVALPRALVKIIQRIYFNSQLKHML